MKAPTKALGLALVFSFGILAQQEPAFEVASIRVVPGPERAGFNGDRRGGPGTSEKGRISFSAYRVPDLVMTAYDLKGFQIDRTDFLRPMPAYDITANIPDGATQEQFQSMLRRLLAERFHLKVHWQKKPGDVQALILAKGGHKLKRPTAKADPAQTQPVSTADSLPKGVTTVLYGAGRARMQAVAEPVSWLVFRLSADLDAPVVDETGLTGEYDYNMEWKWGPAQQGDFELPELDTALIQQLGLQLRKRKGEIDMLVIDSYDRVPVEN